VTQYDTNILLSSFAVLGTPYCIPIEDLVDNQAIPKHEPIVVQAGESHSRTLDITTTRTVGEETVTYGHQYEKCIQLTVTLDDGVTPAPSFVTFDPLTR